MAGRGSPTGLWSWAGRRASAHTSASERAHRQEEQQPCAAGAPRLTHQAQRLALAFLPALPFRVKILQLW